MGHSDYHTLAYGRMVIEVFFYLCGKDTVARCLDEFLGATADEYISLFIHLYYISGSHPTVSEESFRAGFGFIPVPNSHRRGFLPQFSFLSHCYFFSVIFKIYYPDINCHYRNTYASQFVTIQGIQDSGGYGFAHSKSFNQVAAGHRLVFFDYDRWNRCSPRNKSPQGRDVVVFEVWMVYHRYIHGGYG